MSQPNLEAGKILIVDDHLNNLKVLSNALTHPGWEILVAVDGPSALAQVNYNQPDIVLLDVIMPIMDGFETCRRLKANPITRDIPVIFMTSLMDESKKLEGFEIGAVDYIVKPFTQAEVLARVRTHLRLGNLTRQMEAQNRQLQQVTEHLEQQVIERTFELSTTLASLQAVQTQLQYDALHDALTGLQNRAWLMQQLQGLIDRNTAQQNSLFAILFIDLDHFKVVNDSLGHLVGDELLRGVAQRLRNIGYPGTVTRFGGDEFVILMETISGIEQVTSLAGQIQEGLTLPFQLGYHSVCVGVSIGIALGVPEYQDPADVLRDADTALYQAKKQGRGGYMVFNAAIRTQTMARMQMENDLRQAIATLQTRTSQLSGFCLHYQPIVSLMRGEIAGFEALLRWSHPSGELILPGQFIPIAEETGLIHPLGRWVIGEACRQMQVWQKQFPQAAHWIVNVNISPVQLKQISLIPYISDTLQQTGLAKSRLKLELTESCLLDKATHEITVLNQLKDLGIRLCIDDFGTGYSSFSRLHELPIDTLKIDRSFVNRIGSEADSTEIIRTIMALAHSLSMDVVAEGIEVPLQQRQLEALHCEFGQGYLLFKPLDVETMTRLLHSLPRPVRE
ncbi:GGDEF domain-containing response regulator [Leptolyngbya sp. 'hensonii']|uniref:two-component system response regulator n=1 Tax=Leptolyngbya sp. 'hensonii' TaxID=1922337 RepID=UPI0009501BEB|nr:EAL domain-containing response regulator [Leptolyngbya sp. 'hensonii']OLP16067.1 GGDEF domain-containing response regulator [Leptolyngbya sp. 'hensonii']